MIRNVTVVPREPYGAYYGIDFNHCQNGRIENCTVTGAGTGIGVFSSSNIEVINNRVTGDDVIGIDMTSCADLTVTDNLVDGYGYGVWLRGVDTATVDRNEVTNAITGILLIDCSGVTIGYNDVYGNPNPYYDNSWDDNTWPGSQRVIDGLAGRVLLVGVLIPACVFMYLGAIFMRRRRREVAA